MRALEKFNTRIKNNIGTAVLILCCSTTKRSPEQEGGALWR
jgi:hypothetical protein